MCGIFRGFFWVIIWLTNEEKNSEIVKKIFLLKSGLCGLMSDVFLIKMCVLGEPVD